MSLYEFNIVYLYWVEHGAVSLTNTYFERRHVEEILQDPFP